MIKAIIFDMDGVIFDTEHKRFADIKRILKRHGVFLKKSSFSSMLGKKTEVFVKEVFPGATKSFCLQVAEERRELQHHSLKSGRLIKGVPELLRYIKLEGYKTAITTGSKKPIVKRLLQMYLLTRYFDLIVTGEDFKTSKPNPECYRVTLEKLGVKAREVIVIEDAINGVKAAKKLGCTVFGLRTYLSGKALSEADRSFATHKEILQFLKTKKI